MAHNLFVSYDLRAPGQNYESVIDEIKKQGTHWARIHYSLFYLKSNENESKVADAVWAKMDKNDRLLVINATTNSAAWYNLSTEVSNAVKEQWNK